MDFSLARGVCVSASGEPSYHQAECCHATLMLFDLRSLACLHTLREHTDSINAVRLSEDADTAIRCGGKAVQSCVRAVMGRCGHP